LFSSIKQAVPCHFKERLNDFADKWMHCAAGAHRFELYLRKDATRTFIMGPFWYDLILSHGVNAGDVVTFTLREEEEIADDSDDEDDDMLVYEQAFVENVFEITVAKPNGTNKPFGRVEGI
jgi:hypothetical protein